MPAPFVVGTNATINSPCPEGQLITAIILLQIYESIPAHNPDNRDYVQGSFNINTKKFAATITMPCIQGISLTGEATYTANNYIQVADFTPGNPPGTFKSTNLPSYLIEVLTYCQLLESMANVNRSNKDSISYSYDGNTSILTASVSLDCNMGQNDVPGGGFFSVQPYLSLEYLV